jgi:hypothetical protein
MRTIMQGFWVLNISLALMIRATTADQYVTCLSVLLGGRGQQEEKVPPNLLEPSAVELLALLDPLVVEVLTCPRHTLAVPVHLVDIYS